MVTTRTPKGRLREMETERYILSTLPLLWLPFYRKDGSSFISADGYGHLCTVIGATWGSQGRILDDADDQITLTLDSGLSGSFTIIAWVNTSAFVPDETKTILSSYVASYDNYWAILFLNKVGNNPIHLGCNLYDGTNNPLVTGTSNLFASTWYHATFVRDTVADTISLYLNGDLDATPVTDTTTNVPTYSIFAIGNNYRTVTPLDYFGGTQGELAAWSRAFTAAEIRRNYLITRWRYQ